MNHSTSPYISFTQSRFCLSVIHLRYKKWAPSVLPIALVVLGNPCYRWTSWGRSSTLWKMLAERRKESWEIITTFFRSRIDHWSITHSQTTLANYSLFSTLNLVPYSLWYKGNATSKMYGTTNWNAVPILTIEEPRFLRFCRRTRYDIKSFVNGFPPFS